jgi:hypothetical protein
MVSKGQKLATAGAAFLIAEPALAFAHTGGIGTIVALTVGAAAYAYADDIVKMVGRDTTSLPVSTAKDPGSPSLGYRLLNGKSTRGKRWDEHTEDNQITRTIADDCALPQGEGGSFTFSALLATGWLPSYDQIFLARLEEGTDIFVSVEHLVHIALAGSTRQGKTSIIRQLLLQLCRVGCCCVLLDPHYTPYDVETDEDWTPFVQHLRFDPLECKSYRKIEQILRYAATTLLDHRKQLREQMKPVGTPTFLVLDEYPAIIAEVPAVEKYVAKLLREGAKYKIFLCVAGQDFQVKTVSPQSGGAIRDSYKTCLYVGGDPTTAKVLLDKTVPPTIEVTLGKGPVMLRCEVVKEASLAQTAYTDNEALYQLLGPSTYQSPHRESSYQDDDPLAEHSNERDFEEELDDGEKNEPQPERLALTPVIAEKGRRAEEIDPKLATEIWNAGYSSKRKLMSVFGITDYQALKLMKIIGVKEK